LDELKGTEEFHSFQTREFQPGASEMEDPLSRRQFLGLMGASMALAGLAGCRKPVEKIVPYIKTPEETVIGHPEQYATNAVIAGSVTGLLVTSRDGRPIKIDGNPLHPASLGGSNVFQQAEILNLYDPDRSKKVLNHGVEGAWGDVVEAFRSLRDHYLGRGGFGLAVVSEEIHSPTLLRMKAEFLKQYPKAQWVIHQTISDRNVYNGTKQAFGSYYRPVYDFGKAKVILSLDSDFLMTETDAVAASRQYAEGRKPDAGEMNRLYVVESNFSTTGANADHRLKLASSRIHSFVAALAVELSKLGVVFPKSGSFAGTYKSYIPTKWVAAVAKDLAANRGKGLVVAGRSYQSQAFICELNQALGNVGETVSYVPVAPESIESYNVPFGWDWTSFAQNMQDKKSVSTLVLVGGNGSYATSGRTEIETAVKDVEHLIELSLHKSEISALAEWHIPQAHFLETWGDGEATDGSVGIQQPLIEPLFNGKSEIELLALLMTGQEGRGYALVRETWKGILPAVTFEKDWRKVLHDGVFAGSAKMGENPSFKTESPTEPGIVQGDSAQDEFGVEINFRPSPSVWDGRYANNGWLQELPDPMTKLVWDNAALVSSAYARKIGAESGDVIKISFAGKDVEAPVFILPGHADDSITITLGYGRKGMGRVAEKAGFDTSSIRFDGNWNVKGEKTDGSITSGGVSVSDLMHRTYVGVTKTGKTYAFATSQNHHSMEGRPIVREGTLEEYEAHPEFAAEMVEQGAAPAMWDEHKYDEGYQWGMTIDLNTCTGCNACAIACQSENNIPIVGKDQVARGREMHWIRLDRYFTGDEENPQAVTQPVACQQCEMAPCEQVCPVAATSHDHEGLNVMTYNRCVGTRYCANNCPYKVRRFNFFNFTNKLDDLIQMAQNPDVTVRSRGVMEKCTYCVQRINRGKHNAKMENREVRDGEVVSACQAACPAGAIVFGNLNDPNSAVSKSKKEHRKYDLLGELNTRPRTSYLAKIRNVNAEIGEG